MGDIVLESKRFIRKYVYGMCSVEITMPDAEYDEKVKNYLKLNCFEESHNSGFDEQIKFSIIIDNQSQIEEYSFKKNKFKSSIKIHNKTQYEEEKYVNYYEENEILYFYNRYLDTFVKFDKKNKTIVVLGNAENTAKQTLDLMREQIIPKSIESNGCFFLKCASFIYDNKKNYAGIIMGESNSGKTTVLLNVLKNNLNYKYVCNSAAYLQKKDKIELMAWRPHMRIRVGTAKQFPEVVSYIKSNCKDSTLIHQNVSDDAVLLKTYDEFHMLFSNEHRIQAIPKKLFFIGETKDSWTSYLRYGYDSAHPDYLCLEKYKDFSREYVNSYTFMKEALLEQCEIVRLMVDFEQIAKTVETIRSSLLE